MFASNTSAPSTFACQIDVAGLTATWDTLLNSDRALVAVIDSSLTATAQNATILQELLIPDPHTFDLPAAPLISGKSYLFTVAVADQNNIRLGFCSKTFTAP